jgi:integrase
MSLDYKVVEIKSSSAERMVILLRRTDGLPPYWPNLFALTHFRNVSAATNTVRRVIKTLAIIYTWAQRRGIDIDHHLSREGFLTESQVEDLAVTLRYHADELGNNDGDQRRTQPPKTLEQVRRTKTAPGRVLISANEASVRMRYASRYLRWHGERRLSAMLRTDSEAVQVLQTAIHRACAVLERTTPNFKSQNDLEARHGLAPDERALLVDILRPNQPSNPFTGAFVQVRNDILINTMLATGARAGELLQMKIEDLDFARTRIRIHRSPDDPDDPRVRAVHTKTRARDVPVSEGLMDSLREFIRNHWNRIPPRHRQHGYLWTTQSGRPLAQASLNYIFQVIRKSEPRLPGNFCAHVMRHTWNEVFSEAIDRGGANQRVTQEQEARIRERLMGWTTGSKMAAVYNRRYDRRKADEIAEEMATSIVRNAKKAIEP